MTGTPSISSSEAETAGQLPRDNSSPTRPRLPEPPLRDRAKTASGRVVSVEWGFRVGSGQCVALAQHLGFRINGRARDWLENAQVAGYRIGRVPEVGAAVVTSESSYGTDTGHVGVVEALDEEWVYLVESNYVPLTVSHGRLPLDSPLILGYIYRTD